jgi:hypothetical protein
MKEAEKELEELTKRPFVLRLDRDAEIISLENADEYWTKIIQTLRDVLSKGKQTPQTARAIGSVVSMFEQMPPEVRLAKLTESIQPMFEFANMQISAAEPIHEQIETASPFGGTIKQDVIINLTNVEDGLAYVTVRMTVPRAELEKLSKALFDKLSNGAFNAEQVAKAKDAISGLKDFKSETVAEYRVRIKNGMLESFKSAQTISANAGKESEVRVKTRSLRRID